MGTDMVTPMPLRMNPLTPGWPRPLFSPGSMTPGACRDVAATEAGHLSEEQSAFPERDGTSRPPGSEPGLQPFPNKTVRRWLVFAPFTSAILRHLTKSGHGQR